MGRASLRGILVFGTFPMGSTRTTAPVSHTPPHLGSVRWRCRRWPALTRVSLPLELAFWALWHCRHARPPDSAPV